MEKFIKNLLYPFIVFFFLITSSGFADAQKTCEEIGAESTTRQVYIQIGSYLVPSGEPQVFCKLWSADHLSFSNILASTLLSTNSSLAGTAYRNGPKPLQDGARSDRTYCKKLGGTYQYGANVQPGGWVALDAQEDTDSICVFADGSMISTWTLFYKRAGNKRPDFESFFQNKPMYDLW